MDGEKDGYFLTWRITIVEKYYDIYFWIFMSMLVFYIFIVLNFFYSNYNYS